MAVSKEAWVHILAEEDERQKQIDDIMNLLFTSGPSTYSPPAPTPQNSRPPLQYYDAPASGLTIEQVAKDYAEKSMKLYDVDWTRGEYHAMVPVSELRKYREYDRAGEGANPDSTEAIEALTRKIKEEGFKIPVHITVYGSGKRPKLTEGNHRLVVAERLGLKELPVVFFFQ